MNDASTFNEILEVSIRLRDYQERDLAGIRDVMRDGCRRVLYVAPTGSGKTVLFGWLARSAASKGKRVLVLTHRRELLRQTTRRMAEMGAEVDVTTVQAVARFGEVPTHDLLIVDESHHSSRGTQWHAIINRFRGHVLGVTATPERLDGKGLRDSFDEMVVGPTVHELIDQGWLADFRAMSAPRSRKGIKKIGGDFARAAAAGWVSGQPKIVGDCVEEWREHVRGPALAFCATVEHAETVAAEMREKGLRAASIDGRMGDVQREKLIEAIGDGGLDVLTSCDLIGEGLDVPEVKGVIMLRPTASLALHLQQVGRALRPKVDGGRAVILDHVGNCGEHGLPNEHRLWSLDGRKARQAAEAEAEARGGGGKRKAPETIEGKLRRMDPVILAQWRSDKQQAVRGARSYSELRLIVAALSWKPGAAYIEARRRGWLR